MDSYETKSQYDRDVIAQNRAAASYGAVRHSARRALPRPDEAQRALEIVLGCVREDISLAAVRRACDTAEAHLKGDSGSAG